MSDLTKGKFIAIEGGDAGGKATQSRLLAEKLDALLLSFPRYETEIGKLIRANLKGLISMSRWSDGPDGLSGDKFWCEPKSDALVRQALFALDRYAAARDILDALANGRNVVADRYWVSGLIYGSSDLVDTGMLKRVHECLPQPDVWIMLDVPVDESFRRRPLRQDAYEVDREKLEDVRQRYLKLFYGEQRDVERAKNLASHLASCNGCDLDRTIKLRMQQTWAIVDGLGTIEQVHNRIMGVI